MMWAQLDENNEVAEIIKRPKPITVDGVQHPRAIFEKWSEAELNAIGIYLVEYDDTPPDEPYEVTGEAHVFDEASGRVLITRQFQERELRMPRLSAVQIRLLLMRLGMSEADILAWLNSMPEGTAEEQQAKAEARIRFERATRYERDDPFVLQAQSSFGIPDSVLDPLWREVSLA